MIPGTILNITLDTKSDSDYFLIIAVFLFRGEVFHNILRLCIYKAQEKHFMNIFLINYSARYKTVKYFCTLKKSD